MKFKKTELQYEYNDLEPFLDAKTVEIHYTKHHAAYEANFNKGIEGTEYENYDDVLNIMAAYKDMSGDIKTITQKHGGGLVNHNFFFSQFRSDYSHEEWQLRDSFFSNYPGGIEKFKEEFTQMSLSVFGSGWIWAIINNGQLEITTTPNQENPWMHGNTDVIFGVDLWEHSYYLKYQQDRKSYVEACIELFLLRTNAKAHEDFQ